MYRTILAILAAAARRFNIRTTPTTVFPERRVVAGAIGAEAILALLKESVAPPIPKGDSP
jgi:protein-disulfide isomerase